MKKIKTVLYSIILLSTLQIAAMQSPTTEFLTVPHDITFRFPDGTTVTHSKGTTYQFKKGLFFNAAFDNRIDHLYQFIKLGYPIDTTDNLGFTALACAAKSEWVKSGCVEAVQLLLEHGADANYPNTHRGNQTALHDCINGKIAQALIKGGANINQPELLGITPLMLAGHNDRHEVVHVLLAANALVDARNASGLTALMMAAMNNKPQFAKALVTAKADLNLCNDARNEEESGTALILAAGHGNVEVLRILIDARADLNAQTKSGMTALMKAVLYATVATKMEQVITTHSIDGKKEYTQTYSTDGKCRVVGEMVKALIKAGAHTTLKNEAGKTALMLAKDLEYQGAYLLLLDASKGT